MVKIIFMSITVKNISKSFGSQKALSNISFTIGKGEIVGFLGPNGAGKSTLMKILTTYSLADSGEAAVNSFNVQTNKKEVQKSIGYLPEHNPLYLDMYVKEYLAFNANVYKVRKDRIETVIDQTDPKVLILDEPTTGLDPNQLLEIRKLIKEIGKEKTILLSTHIMKEVEAVCDRVIIINKGVIVADKKLEELRSEEEQIIEVEFDYRVEEAFLLKLPNVVHVKNVMGFVYDITFNTSIDMRPIVFDFAHDNQLKTLQLSRKNKNLESLFTELTTN